MSTNAGGGVPAVIGRYFDAHDGRDSTAALAEFAPDAVVSDDGHEYVGADAILHWLGEASTKFTYTRTLVSAEALDETTWIVVNRLEGDFPGGVVDLRYRFELRDGAIGRLAIAP